MSDPLYHKDILRLAADARLAGRMAAPDATGIAHNPACGDKVTLDIRFNADGGIAEVRHETRACVLAQASATLLARHLPEAGECGIAPLAAQIADMLAGAGTAPAKPFAGYAVFAGVAEHAGRHRCVLLPVEAAAAALKGSKPE